MKQLIYEKTKKTQANTQATTKQKTLRFEPGLKLKKRGLGPRTYLIAQDILTQAKMLVFLKVRAGCTISGKKGRASTHTCHFVDF